MRDLFGTTFAFVVLMDVAGLGSASAADLPVKAPPVAAADSGWSGWYAGVNGGYAWDHASGSLVAFSTTPAGNNFAPAVAAGGTPGFLGAKHEGGFGGGQLGYNWQIAKWLVGFEADIQGAGIGQTSTISFPGGGGILPSVSTGRDHINWFGTFRGRVGVTANRVLYYATGGLAYGGISSSVTNLFTPGVAGSFAGSSGTTSIGWAAGAGVEWSFAPKWSLKGEYLHVDLGQSNTTLFDPVNFPGAFATYRFSHAFDSVRVGVNYHFAGPVVAKY